MLILYDLILVVQTSGRTLYSLLPYVIAGVLLSEALSYTTLITGIHRFSSRSPFLSVIASVFAGMISPLCTYGTIPVILRLFRSGVPIAPLIVFLASSSMMNPQLFILTVGSLGIGMAAARILSIIVFTLILGLIVHFIPSEWMINPGCLRNQSPNEDFPESSVAVFSWKRYFSGCVKSLEFIGFYLIIGILLGAAVEVLLPQEWLASNFQSGSWLSILLASILGIPLYACGGASIPLISSLVKEGLSKGAALAFLTTGPATRIQPLVALAALLRPRFIFFYVLLIVVFSMFVGILFN
ncbi:MAG: permease [Clostridia bacterium]|nr:permease [Clostridia bacterium]